MVPTIFQLCDWFVDSPRELRTKAFTYRDDGFDGIEKENVVRWHAVGNEQNSGSKIMIYRIIFIISLSNDFFLNSIENQTILSRSAHIHTYLFLLLSHPLRITQYFTYEPTSLTNILQFRK